MILGRAAIERHLLDAGRQGTLGHRLANGLRGRSVATVLHFTAQFLVDGASGDQGTAGSVVDHLRVHVLVTAKNSQPRTISSAVNAFPHAEPSPLPLSIDGLFVIHGRSFGSF